MTARLGQIHNWRYRSRWREKKIKAGQWRFSVKQVKTRVGRRMRHYADAPRGTTFHWLIRGKQVLTKISPNTYRGTFKGRKYFVKRTRH